MAEQTQEQETQQPAVQSTMSAAPKQLAATDILSKMQTGTPLVQGEKLPDVPKGMSAKSFYGQFPGGAAVYSQAPFKQPTYGQVTTPAPATPVSPPADTTPVDTAPIVEEEEENITGGDSPEDTALDEAIAESTSTSTQMDDLFDFNIDSGYTFDYDSNLTLTENIANEFNDFGLALTADISSVTDGTVVLNDIDKTLTNIGTSLNTAYNNALQEGEDSLLSFIDETKSILDDIEAYAANPETIATDTFNYVSEALTDFYDNLSLMTQPDHPDFDLALQDLATGVTKGMMGAVIGAITGVPVIGTLFVELVTNSEFFSNAMIGYPGQTETVTWNKDTKTYDVEYTPTNIAFFDGNGVARDINGKEVLTGRGGVNTAGPTFVVPGHIIIGKTTPLNRIPSKLADVEGGGAFDPYGQMDVAVTPGDLEYGGGGGTDIGGGTDAGNVVNPGVDQGFGGATNIGPTDTQIDPATIQDFSGIPTTDPGIGYVDTFEDAPVDSGYSGGLDADAAADLGEDSPDGGEGDDGGVSGPGDGDPKIICTMMNRMYGMGDYRIKQWLLYSDRHLTAEHQLGYHKLYCKLVSMMPSNKIVAKILSHMAEKRTDDIVAEMKHTKRSWLGCAYRTLLIDKPSYVVGWMIKRNWLQPADISILTRKTCNG